MKIFFINVQLFFESIAFSLKDYFATIYDEVRLKFSIRLAEAKKRAYIKRYYVIEDYYHRLCVVNNSDIKRLKKMNLMNPKATHLDIMRECLYYTNVNDNDKLSVLSPEEKAKRVSRWLKSLEEFRTRTYQYKIARLNKKKERLYGRKKQRSNH